MWSVLTDLGLFNRLLRKKCPKMVFFLPKKSGFWSKGLFFTRDACDFSVKYSVVRYMDSPLSIESN